MAQPILMPRPGQMTEECTLVSWHKAEGEQVVKGDVLFEIETDKALMEIEAFDEGVLLRQLVQAGETVPVNSIVAYVGQAGEQVPESPAAPADEPPVSPVPSPAETTDSGSRISPLASPVVAPEGRRLRISPRASRLAAEAGVDTRALTGTGPGGRIVERDVHAALERATATVSLPADADEGEEPPRPLSPMRRVIARRMTLSATQIPQYQVTVAVDVTRLVALRDRLKAEGSALTLTDFVMAATARSLVETPIVNSLTDGDQVWLRRRVHLGLAVAVPNGLVVIVVRDADGQTIDQIHERASSMAAAARDGKLSPDDMTGSTFSISNLGMFGIESFSAIINPGESAVLAVSSSIRQPVVVGEGIGIRSVMRLTLSADHRLIDGETAARFLGDLRARLEDPEALRTAQPGL